jgi:NADPH-dependent 2,4-dienoyl-CoA reductase/sulfur reductase-like enzyme/bacterioferritin-associated ferredoxin
LNDRVDEPPLNPEPEAAPGPEQTLIIIGNGMMSFRLCQKLVECGAEKLLEIVVFGEEPRPAYDRVHLTDLLSGKTADDLTLAPPSWYAEHGIALYLGDPVVEINTDDCLVRSASGLVVPYDRLVFATGSRPFVPPIPGVELPGVFVYRTVEHLHAIMDHGYGVERAAVIGGGLLGLEAAKAIYDLGLEVHVIESGAGLMHRQLDAAGSGLLKSKIEELGVRVHLGKQTARIEEARASDPDAEEGELRVRFADGGSLIVNMVVISAGIRPRGELAGATGLALARNGGIIVDDRLTTSDPRIFAVGECAVHRGVTYGLAFPGYKMVDNLVDNLVGGTATFQGADLSAKLKLMGITVASLGDHDEKDRPNTTVNSFLAHGAYRKVVMREGRIVGAITVGDWENLDRVREAIEQPRVVSFWDMRRFRSTGNLWLKSESAPIADWPPDAMVCGCLRVNRGTLSLAQLDGCATVDELCARTGAGTMCGSCKPLLAELLSGDAGPPSTVTRDSVPPSTVRREPPSRTMRGRDVPPSSLPSREHLPLAVLNPELGPASVRSQRRSMAPSRDAVLRDRFTPTPRVALFRSVPPIEPTMKGSPSITPQQDDDPDNEDSGPLSRRGSFLPPVQGRRKSARSLVPEPTVHEASAFDEASEAHEVPPTKRPPENVVPDGAVSAPASTRRSFKPPEQILFVPTAPRTTEDTPSMGSSRVPVMHEVSGAGKSRFKLSPDLEEGAPASRRSILPPEQEPQDSILPPPESTADQSLRDLLALSARGSSSLKRQDSAELLRVAALLEEGEERESPLPHDSARERELDARDGDRDRDAPGKSDAPPTWHDSSPPSRRRDSLPPLRPLSVIPPRSRSTPPGRLSAQAPKAPEERGLRPLLAVAVVASVMVLSMATLSPIPVAASIQGSHLDALWTTDLGKQITGYAVVALALASLLLSLRKRWKRFAYSDVPIFRLVHGALAALTLIVLVLHTGLHLGKNLNRMLMIDFLTLSLIGALAAGVTALSHWWSPITARNQRLVWYRAHFMLFLPLPVLLALHILGAYYY